MLCRTTSVDPSRTGRLLGSLRLVLRGGSVLLVERGVADLEAGYRGDGHQDDQDEGDAYQQAGEEPCTDIMLASVIVEGLRGR